MELYLLKSFHFRDYEILPYRSDGRGGNVFHGVGSHVLYSNLRHRWYRFAFEVATVDQPAAKDLIQTRIHGQIHGKPLEIQHNSLEFTPEVRRPTLDPKISSYQWIQLLEIDAEQPSLIELSVEMQFSDSESWIPVEGRTRVLVDLHPGEPPKHYNKIAWFFKRLRGGAT